jgi:hypothetical protein
LIIANQKGDQVRSKPFYKISRFIAVFSIAVFIGCNGSGGGNGDNDPPVAPDPPVADALQGLQFFEGWTDPRKLVGPVNTAGWEDSAFISSDGYMLYFGYSPLDYYEFTQGRQAVVGPTGPPKRPDQHGNSFDIYEALIPDPG